MNWKVRLKNPVWWSTTVPVVIGCVYLLLKSFDIAPVVTENDLATAIVSAATVICGFIGGTNDPTTTGLTDSARAKAYDTPNNEK